MRQGNMTARTTSPYKPGKSCSGAALGTTRVPPTAKPRSPRPACGSRCIARRVACQPPRYDDQPECAAQEGRGASDDVTARAEVTPAVPSRRGKVAASSRPMPLRVRQPVHRPRLPQEGDLSDLLREFVAWPTPIR